MVRSKEQRHHSIFQRNLGEIVPRGGEGRATRPRAIRWANYGTAPIAHQWIISIGVRFVRRNILFYDEEVTDPPRFRDICWDETTEISRHIINIMHDAV